MVCEIKPKFDILFNNPDTNKMIEGVTISLVISMMLIIINCQDCNSTHFQFFSQYSLGKQDQLNKTFDSLKNKTQIPDSTFKISDFDSLNLTNINTSFQYLDSKQKAQTVGSDTIMIDGGRVQAILTLNWVKFGLSIPQNGTCVFRVSSDSILFEKKIDLLQGYFDYVLVDYYNITFRNSNFQLSRIQPARTSPQIIDLLLKIANEGDGQKASLKSMLSDAININFPSQLKKYLKDEHFDLWNKFQYNWKNQTISYVLLGTGAHIDQEGLKLTYVSKNKEDTKWKCGSTVATTPLNPSIYGGTQQFIEFSVFQNTIRYSLETGVLNTELNKQNWETKYFQFYAGDLYEVIPSLMKTYFASDKISGVCQFSRSKKEPIITRSTNYTINVTSDHECSLKITNSEIIAFNITLLAEVQVEANNTHLNFRVKEVNGSPEYKAIQGFEIENKQLASFIINKSLQRMQEGYSFGSGWKIYPRDYTHVLIEKDIIIIYDSTQVPSGANSKQMISL